MQKIAEMPWLHDAIDRFHQLIVAERLPHALLLQGREGDGSEVLAQTLAKAALCSAPELGYPCNHCKSCLLHQADTHPDCIKIVPGGASATVRVDEIRLLVDRFNSTAQIAQRKVALILHAETMNTAAANALLKTLEEPPGDSLLILVTEGTKPLLPTVRSRCQRITMQRPDADQIKAWLAAKDYTGKLSEDLLEALDYQPLRLMHWIEEDMQPHWDHFQAIMSGVADMKLSPVSAAIECKDVSIGDQLDWIDKRLYRVIRNKVAQGTPPKPQESRYLVQLTALRGELVHSANVNAQLFSENLFMLWQQFNRQSG
jgi:DNA polymerase III subunit delta'